MHKIRKQRLFLILSGMLVLIIGTASILFALRSNINLFYTPTEIVEGQAPTSQTIRLGGIVASGSVSRGRGVDVEFAVSDTVNSVKVKYSGILPDLFKENEGVVAIGELNTQGVLLATEVLAKHDENYMPPEAMEAIKRAHKNKS